MEKLNDTKLEGALNSLKQTPTNEWSLKAEESLKNFTLSDQKEYTNINYFNYILMRNKLLVASVVTVAVFVVAISAFSVYYLSRLRNAATLSKQETLDILSKVLANNSVSTFQEGGSLAPARSADASATASSLTIAPIIDDFNGANYRYTRTTVTEGPAASRCTDAFGYSNQSAISDTYEYRPNGGEDYKSYMYKYVNYTANNQITNLTVSKYEGNNSIYFEYAGGSYAVKNVYDMGPNGGDIKVLPAVSPMAVEDSAAPDQTTTNVDVAPTEPSIPTDEVVTSEPTPIDYESLVAQYFGADAQIVNTVTEGSNTYYVLRYSYGLLCNGQETTAVYENKINSETYAISDTKTYLGSADAANLVSSTTVQVETKTIAQADANGIFVLGINVPVKDVVYPYVPAEEYSAEKEAVKTLDALKSTSTLVLFPESYKLSYGYSYLDTNTAPANADYRADRAFYPSGALGDEMFSIYNPSTTEYLNPESNWNFIKTENNDALYLESFKAGTTVAQVSDSKSQVFTDIQNKSAVNVQIKINGANVNATLLTFTASQDWVYLREGAASVSSSSGVATDSRIMPPTSGDGSTNYEFGYIIFDYQGHVYSISRGSYTGTKIAAADVVLKSYNPNNASDYAFLKTELLNVVNVPIAVDGGIGDGSSSNPGSSDIACTMEAKQCPDGSYVGRNSKLNCEFDACP